MTTTVGYTTDDDLSAYAAARGVMLSGDVIVSLTLAMDYLELQNYSGSKTDDTQNYEFPRNDDTEVPARIIQAQHELAIIYNAGGDMYKTIDQQVIEKTVGPLTTKYSDGSSQNPIYPKIQALIAPYLASGGGANNVSVSRG